MRLGGARIPKGFPVLDPTGRGGGARVSPEGRLDLDQAEELISERTKIVALAHQSNVLGTINPVADIAARAHAVGALVLVDAAQSVPHGLMDVGSLGADFVGFTGHKMCGPTGI